MKRQIRFTSLLSVVVVALGIAACATATGEDETNIGQSRQAICKGEFPCGGFEDTSGDDLPTFEVADPEPEPEPPPPSFYCPPRFPEYLCGPVLKLVNGAYYCVNSCSGGAFVTHAANPCGLAYPNYYCTSWGSCTCTK